MSSTTVFVDDAVRGDLPPRCVKDGTPTDHVVPTTREVGASSRLGVLWLLVLAGPLGWIALAVIAATRSGGEQLTVLLPYSLEADERRLTALRARNAALVVGVAGTVALLALTVWLQLAGSGLLLAGLAAVGTAVAAGTGEWRVGRESVDVELDGSRRWVTLRRVHPSFAASCDAHQEHQRHR